MQEEERISLWMQPYPCGNLHGKGWVASQISILSGITVLTDSFLNIRRKSLLKTSTSTHRLRQLHCPLGYKKRAGPTTPLCRWWHKANSPCRPLRVRERHLNQGSSESQPWKTSKGTKVRHSQNPHSKLITEDILTDESSRGKKGARGVGSEEVRNQKPPHVTRIKEKNVLKLPTPRN